MQFVVDQPLDETKEPNRRVDENTQLHVNDETPIEEIVCFLILSTDTHRPDTRTYSPYQVPQATIQNAIAEAKAGRFTREMLFHRSNGMVRAQAEQVSDRVLTVSLCSQQWKVNKRTWDEADSKIEFGNEKNSRQAPIDLNGLEVTATPLTFIALCLPPPPKTKNESEKASLVFRFSRC
jgi:hypothetical protein